MLVKDYYPIFYANDINAETKRFTEELGFEVIHRPNIEYLDYLVLENKNKRRVDLVCSHFPSDAFKEGYLGMRANVDNYDEGVAYFESQGYHVFGTAHESQASIAALMTKDDNTYIVIFYHKK